METAKGQFIFTGLLVAASAGWAAAAESSIVFKDAFDGTGNKPFGCTDACSLSEYPPSVKTLCFRPLDNKQADVYKGFCRLPKGAPRARTTISLSSSPFP